MPSRPSRPAAVQARACIAAALVLPCLGCATPQPAGDYLVAWAADADSADRPFLAVIDLEASPSASAAIVATLPLGDPGDDAHHTELTSTRTGSIWANSFFSNATFLVDLRSRSAPVLRATLADPPGLEHPHSFHRLDDGRLLVTYQLGELDGAPGGLAEHDSLGTYLRGASALDPRSAAFVRPYSLAVVPSLDRVVTTGADMHGAAVSRVVQVWSLRDLELLHTLELSDGPRGGESAHSFEPRVLADGETVLVVTLGCGLYRVEGLASEAPRATLVHDFGARRCFMPAVVGDWWVQAIASDSAIDVLDVSDPASPRHAHRLRLPEGWVPHWLATDGHERVVVTGYRGMSRRLLVLRLDLLTGSLAVPAGLDIDSAAFSFERDAWPHGATGAAVPHGAVFLRAPAGD